MCLKVFFKTHIDFCFTTHNDSFFIKFHLLVFVNFEYSACKIVISRMKLSLMRKFHLSGSVVWANSCGACGKECEKSCGTKFFKSCCHNYLRKRADLPEMLSLIIDPANQRLHKSVIPSLRRLNFDEFQEYYQPE